MIEITCPNCQKILDLSFIIGQKKIEKNSTTCHVCHHPYDIINKPKRKRNRNPNPKSNDPLPTKNKEEILLLKKKKEITLSGETKSCKRCAQEKPIERFSSYKKPNGQMYQNVTCMDCAAIHSKRYYHANSAEIKEKVKKRNNLEEVKIAKAKKRKEMIAANPEYYKALRALRAQKPEVKLARRIRNRLAKFLKYKSSDKVSAVIGCSGNFLKKHLESKFQKGMTWENYGYGQGKWVIDHIKPLSLFNRLDKEDLKRASHYTNLQPLWYHQNDAKDANYDPDHPMGWKGLDELIER